MSPPSSASKSYVDAYSPQEVTEIMVGVGMHKKQQHLDVIIAKSFLAGKTYCCDIATNISSILRRLSLIFRTHDTLCGRWNTGTGGKLSGRKGHVASVLLSHRTCLYRLDWCRASHVKHDGVYDNVLAAESDSVGPG